MKIIIIPARMNSKRFRGKALKKINNFEILKILINRLKKVRHIKKFVISTTKNKIDNKIINFCKREKISFDRGDSLNVAKRLFKTAKKFKAKYFVRINGDSPFIHYNIIDKAIKIYKKKKVDIVTNIFPRTFPIGQSVEVIRTDTLGKNLKFFKKKKYKEHVTKYFYDNYKMFKIINIKNGKNFSNFSLAIDTKKDFNKFKNLNLTNGELVNLDMKKILKKFYEEN